MNGKSMGRSIVSGIGLVVVVLLATAAFGPAAGTEDAAQPAQIPLEGAIFDAAWEPDLCVETVEPEDGTVEQAILDLEFTPTPDIDAQPVSICRMAPQCATDSDCDAICGAGQGRCGHSRCPVRVCKCS
jgi:hypothetical protein